MNTIIITVPATILNTSVIELAIFAAGIQSSRTESIFLDAIEECIHVNLN